MHTIGVIRSIFRASSIGVIIFFILNASMMISIFGANDSRMIGQIIFLYTISVIVSLSPIGEWLLSSFAGAKVMRRMDMRKRILPLIEQVYDRAKAETPSFSDGIIIKVMYDPNPNAFAIGRKTICVTEGLFELPDEMIEGILAHEIGHLALHHTEIQLLIGGGNFIVTAFIMFANAVSTVLTSVSTFFALRSRSCMTGCLFSVVGVLCAGMIWLWTRFCMLFLMWSSRANEYEADEYAFKLGYGYELAQALDTIGAGVPQNAFLQALYSTHPETNDRIGRLQELGVPYSRF